MLIWEWGEDAVAFFVTQGRNVSQALVAHVMIRVSTCTHYIHHSI